MDSKCAEQDPIITIGILGSNGQLGRALCRMSEKYAHIRLLAYTRDDVDFAQSACVERFKERLIHDEINILINAAAWTDVPAAQTHEREAFQVNAYTPEILARHCREHQIGFVHISTDYVFGDTHSDPHKENDPTHPLNVYGQSKCEGEKRILQSNPDALILRTAWVCAPEGRNFLRTILTLALTRETLDVVHDQVGTPTSADFLARVTLQAALALYAHRLLPGIYHAVPRGFCSWWEFARWAVAYANDHGAHLSLNQDNIQAVDSSAWPSLVNRTHNSRLDNRKLESALQIQFESWQEAMTPTLSSILFNLKR